MKKRLRGAVVSDRMDKTRVVKVTRDVIHPLYKKRYKKAKRFYAHDEGNATKVGDVVTIEETRPLSKLKRWRIIDHATSNLGAVIEEGEERTKPQGPPLAGERGKGKRRVPSQGKA